MVKPRLGDSIVGFKFKFLDPSNYKSSSTESGTFNLREMIIVLVPLFGATSLRKHNIFYNNSNFQKEILNIIKLSTRLEK